MSNHLQHPFQDVVGDKSPVQQGIKTLWRLVETQPLTKAATEQSRLNAALVFTHLLGLMNSAGMINAAGYHSAAITLFRAIEDATDCFSAIASSHDYAIMWQENRLKASEAAKKWTAHTSVNSQTAKPEYRKMIRDNLNKYSHCTPSQAHWNIYLESIGNSKCISKLNFKHQVINLNGYYIDRYLCIHILELLEIVFDVYAPYFVEQEKTLIQLQEYHTEIEQIVKEFLEFIAREKLDVSIAPEIARIKM